jgi:hypothetical protein
MVIIEVLNVSPFMQQYHPVSVFQIDKSNFEDAVTNKESESMNNAPLK